MCPGELHNQGGLTRFIFIALEQIPNSVTLWKQTISLETSPSDARILLARAVEVLPHSVELWLALARLEAPLQAQKVLNKARKAVPTSHEIWIAAGRLVEQNAMTEPPEGEPPKSVETREKELSFVDLTIDRGIKSLREHGVALSRDQWLNEAEKCESDGSLRTAEAIIKTTISMDVEEEDRESAWVADVESALSRGKVVTGRAILAYALRVFPDRRDLWRRAADLEKAHGTRLVFLGTYPTSLTTEFIVRTSKLPLLRQSSIALNLRLCG